MTCLWLRIVTVDDGGVSVSSRQRRQTLFIQLSGLDPDPGPVGSSRLRLLRFSPTDRAHISIRWIGGESGNLKMFHHHPLLEATTTTIITIITIITASIATIIATTTITIMEMFLRLETATSLTDPNASRRPRAASPTWFNPSLRIPPSPTCSFTP